VNENRSGKGGVWFLGIWEFPETDGKGCPVCGACGSGGHGGGCPNWKKQFSKSGKEIA